MRGGIRRGRRDMEPCTAGKMQRLRNIASAFKLVVASSPLRFLLLCIFAVMQAAVTAGTLWLTRSVFNEAQQQMSAIADDRVVMPILLLLLGVALITVLGSIIQNLSSWLSEGLRMEVTDHVADVLHERGNRADLAHFESSEYYDKLHLVQQHAMRSPAGIASGVVDIIRGFLSIAVVGGVMAVIQWELLLLTVLALVPAIWVRVRFARLMREWRRKHASAERRGYYMHYLQSIDIFAKELRSLRIAGHLRTRYREVRKRLRYSRLHMAARQARMSVLSDVAAMLLMGFAFALLALRALKGNLGWGNVAMLIHALQRSRSLLQNLQRSLTRLYEDSVFLDHYREFMDLPDTVLSPDKPIKIGDVRGDVDLTNVSFHYPGCEKDVLRNVSLKIPAGQHVALVGANGAGKTTLVKLLCRLYDPTSGTIMFDGHDIKSFDLDDLRRQVAVLFQDFGKYQMTAAGNIGIGSIENRHSFDDIRKSAHQAGADGFLEKLDRGYRTQLGRWFSGGAEISIGQWQRVALARTLMSKAPVLVMDEPTSALDAKAEAELLERFVDACKGRTLLSVSHRLLTVKHADRIIMMRDGLIVEDGSHAELMDAEGAYYELFRRSAGEKYTQDVKISL